jgi:hypothetical protein
VLQLADPRPKSLCVRLVTRTLRPCVGFLRTAAVVHERRLEPLKLVLDLWERIGPQWRHLTRPLLRCDPVRIRFRDRESPGTRSWPAGRRSRCAVAAGRSPTLLRADRSDAASVRKWTRRMLEERHARTLPRRLQGHSGANRNGSVRFANENTGRHRWLQNKSLASTSLKDSTLVQVAQIVPTR